MWEGACEAYRAAIERSISVSTGGRSTISEQKQESATTVILALVKCMTMYQLCSQIKKKAMYQQLVHDHASAFVLN